MLVIWLLGQVIGFAIGFLYARRRSRLVFERRLCRNGLPEDVIEEITSRYHPPRLLRDAIRSDRF